METTTKDIENVAHWILEAQSAVVLTGAGISTESGIPDFRSPGGVWSKYRTV
jgi:NAD-dependent deacetylase